VLAAGHTAAPDLLIITQVAKLIAADGAAGARFGSSVSASGDTLVVAGGGAAYVFYRDRGGVNHWGQVRQLAALDGAKYDHFGSSASVSGDTLLVGASEAAVGGNQSQGAAYVFSRNRGGADNWGQVKKLIASDGAQYDRFGESVSVSGDMAVVGAPGGGNFRQGAAYVFSRNQGGVDNWDQVKKLIASDGAEYDRFGGSVSVRGDTVVIGASGANACCYEDQGAAYIFSRNQGGLDNWGQVRKLTTIEGGSGDKFGDSVSASGDALIVGALGGGSFYQGAAYVFYRNQGGADSWGRVGQLAARDGAKYDDFGTSVSLSGDMAVVGAPWADVGGNWGQGAAYVFSRNQGGTGQWGQVKKLATSDDAGIDEFGTSVSLNGDTLVVGAPGAVVGGNWGQGAAYVFSRDQGGANHWGRVKKLTAAGGAMGDRFGSSPCPSAGTRSWLGRPMPMWATSGTRVRPMCSIAAKAGQITGVGSRS
jgi:hypothetical protein